MLDHFSVFCFYSFQLKYLYYLQMPYCLLLDGLSKAGQMHEAKSLFEEMKTKNVKSGNCSTDAFPCSFFLFFPYILFWFLFPFWFLIFHKVSFMSENTSLSRVLCFIPLLKLFAMVSWKMHVSSFLCRLSCINVLSFISSDGYAYSIMISAFCRNGLLEEAKQLASDFEATYNTYDLVIMNTTLCAYCRAGDMENVMKTMKKMDELAIPPDWNTFHILIKYFCKEKLYMLAYRTMEDMHRKGHQLEEVCFMLSMFYLVTILLIFD